VYLVFVVGIFLTALIHVGNG